MSVVGNLSRHENLAELTVPREFPSFQTVVTRQAAARTNLGILASLAELTVLDGAVAGTAVAGKAMVTDANNGVGAFRDTRATPVYNQGTPGVLNSTGTLTAAMMLSGIVTSTTAAGVTGTLDTGSNLETALLAIYPGLQDGDSFDFSVIATGANGFTIATAAGWTNGGNAFTAVATVTSGTFRVRRTAANTYTLYRLA